MSLSSLDPTLASLGRSLGISSSRLPTNTTTSSHPVHRWFNFVAGFSPEYVLDCCANLRAGETVLDPFAGCGTSLVAAQNVGLNAVGFEPHPFFSRISTAKTLPLDSLLECTTSLEHTLASGTRHPVSAGTAFQDPPRAFLDKLFDRERLEQLLGCREQLANSTHANDPLAFLVLSRVLDLCSRSKTDGIYKAPTTTKKAADPLSAIRATFSQIRSDLHCLIPARGDVVLHEQSAESMQAVESNSVGIVVTSPPYLNNFDFAEMTRMYLYFWGICASWGDITRKVRSQLILNTTTALAGHRHKQQEHRENIAESVRGELDSVVADLSVARATRHGSKEYDLLVYPYFAQMSRVLSESWRCLKPGGRFHMVVSDAALYGVHVASPQILASIAREIGFTSVECAKIRSRGERWVLTKRSGSPSGLGEYQVVGTK